MSPFGLTTYQPAPNCVTPSPFMLPDMSTKLGMILVDGQGRTLYLLEK